MPLVIGDEDSWCFHAAFLARRVPKGLGPQIPRFTAIRSVGFVRSCEMASQKRTVEGGKEHKKHKKEKTSREVPVPPGEGGRRPGEGRRPNVSPFEPSPCRFAASLSRRERDWLLVFRPSFVISAALRFRPTHEIPSTPAYPRARSRLPRSCHSIPCRAVFAAGDWRQSRPCA